MPGLCGLRLDRWAVVVVHLCQGIAVAAAVLAAPDRLRIQVLTAPCGVGASLVGVLVGTLCGSGDFAWHLRHGAPRQRRPDDAAAQRTRAQDRVRRTDAERALNDAYIAERNKPPPF